MAGTDYRSVGARLLVLITNDGSEAAGDTDAALLACNHVRQDTFRQRHRCDGVEFDHITIDRKLRVSNPRTLRTTGIVH